ncbi:MAG TPA: hypothetical protein VFJ13_09140 [Paracoccaceae bacterium]|nr:hypothetical protein [Paracoccaceae bacterium]
MSHSRALLAIALLALSACASTTHPDPAIRIFNAPLREAFADLDRTMSEPRHPLALSSGVTISTCREYLRHADDIERGRPDQMLALQDYVICDSVALLQRAQPAPSPSIDAGQALATRLDFRTFPSSLGPRTSDHAFSFQALTDEPLVIETNAAMLDSQDWYLRVERVAAADFDGDGREDWLVWIGDASHTGTYQTFYALLVRDVVQSGTLAGDLP